MDDKHAIAHNKITIIDESVVVTGSFNYTKQAEISNAENLLILDSDGPAYKQNWLNHSKHCPTYAEYLDIQAKKKK